MTENLSPGHPDFARDGLIPAISRVCFVHVITCSVDIKATKALLKSRELFQKVKILSLGISGNGITFFVLWRFTMTLLITAISIVFCGIKGNLPTI